MIRCDWCKTDPDYVHYHDEEWGVPVHDDRKLFEMLILEGAQAGLSWLTVLKKREAYREAFAGFHVDKVAAFDDSDLERLLNNPGIIRNRLKLSSAITNARAFIRVRESFGSFDRYIWQFVDGKPIQHTFASVKQLPPSTPRSETMSKDLKKRGFNFVGPTICYSFMQAVGMVNDHIVSCIRYKHIMNMEIKYKK